jgi:hypothetical protein
VIKNFADLDKDSEKDDFEDSGPKSLFMTNLPEFMDEEMVMDIFRNKGYDVESVRIIENSQNEETKKANLYFKSSKEATRCLLSESGTTLLD